MGNEAIGTGIQRVIVGTKWIEKEKEKKKG